MPLPTWPHLPSRRTALRLLAGAIALAALAVVGEALVRARLDEPLRRAGTRIYARPPVLRVGTQVDRVGLERYLARMSYRRTRSSRVGAGQHATDGDTWVIGRRAFRVADQLDSGGVTTVRFDYDGWVAGLEDDRGRWLSQVVLEPEPLRAPGPPGEDRVPVRLSDVPQPLVDAVLAVEDQRFYQHSGVDLLRVAGATLANLRAGHITQGASTITQQLAKNLFLSARRSPVRKLRELAMAEALELRYSKDEILEAYLNEIYLGQDGPAPVRGVGRAAQFYFGKDVAQLGLPEAALLAGLIRGPNLYAPYRRPEAARERRDLVLGLMRDQGKISDRAYRRAAAAALDVRRSPPPSGAGRYFADFAAAELSTRGRSGARGLTVFTTLDMDLQLAAEAAVRRGVARLERDFARLRGHDPPVQAALVALDPITGDVLAMVGGRDYGATQFNRAVQARRQPGSAFKPVVALAALSSRAVTLASRLDDEPLSVETPAGLWQPVNYDRRFRGSVTVRQALEASLNVPFARLGLQVGPEAIAATGRKLGIASPLHAVPSLALGSSEVTPLELARAYGTLAAQGYRADPHAVLGVLDAEGRISHRAERTGEQVFTPAEAFLVTSALEGAVERGTGRGLRTYGYYGPVAAKSGTTNDSRDAWFVGYTPTLVVAVWVGFDDGQSLRLTGSQAALPMVARFLATTAARDQRDFEPPAGVERVGIDPETGLAAGWGCPGEPEYFLPGTAPPAGEGCGGYRRALSRWLSGARHRASGLVLSLLEELRRELRRRR